MRIMIYLLFIRKGWMVKSRKGRWGRASLMRWDHRAGHGDAYIFTEEGLRLY